MKGLDYSAFFDGKKKMPLLPPLSIKRGNYAHASSISGLITGINCVGGMEGRHSANFMLETVVEGLKCRQNSTLK